MTEAYLPKEAATVEHGTPASIFDPLNKEFNFTLDVAANYENALCGSYYTAEDDGTAQDWAGHSVFCNPPYTVEMLKAFTQKALREVANGVTTVFLVPCKTDQEWFHWLWDRSLAGIMRVEFRWIKGRVKYVGNKHTAPFSSVVIVVGPGGKS